MMHGMETRQRKKERLESSTSIDSNTDDISIDLTMADGYDWSERNEDESVEEDQMYLSDFTDTESMISWHEWEVTLELEQIYGEYDTSDYQNNGMEKDAPPYTIETVKELQELGQKAMISKHDFYEHPTKTNLRNMYSEVVNPMIISVGRIVNPNDILYYILNHPDEARYAISVHHEYELPPHKDRKEYKYCDYYCKGDGIKHDGANLFRFVAAIFREYYPGFPLIARLCEYQFYPFLKGFNEVFATALYYYRDNILEQNDDGSERLPLFVALALGYEYNHNLSVIVEATKGFLDDGIVDPLWELPAFAVAAAETDYISLNNPIGTQCNLTTIYKLLRSFPDHVNLKVKNV